MKHFWRKLRAKRLIQATKSILSTTSPAQALQKHMAQQEGTGSSMDCLEKKAEVTDMETIPGDEPRQPILST